MRRLMLEKSGGCFVDFVTSSFLLSIASTGIWICTVRNVFEFWVFRQGLLYLASFRGKRESSHPKCTSRSLRHSHFSIYVNLLTSTASKKRINSSLKLVLALIFFYLRTALHLFTATNKSVNLPSTAHYKCREARSATVIKLLQETRPP